VSPRPTWPTETEADALIRDVELRYPNPDTLDREIARWWDLRGNP
jgi:hypothetical protein